MLGVGGRLNDYKEQGSYLVKGIVLSLIITWYICICVLAQMVSALVTLNYSVVN